MLYIDFLRVMVFRWVRLLLRVQLCNGLCLVLVSFKFYGLLSDGGECLGGPTRLPAFRLLRSAVPHVGRWAWLSLSSIPSRPLCL